MNFSISKRLLVVGPSWVGDMIMAQSLFIVLKQRFPQLQIDVLAPAWSAALLHRMPQISAAIDMPLGHGSLGLKSRYVLGKKLQINNYDQAILLPNSLKSALVPFWASIPRRTGYVGEMRYGLLNDIRKLDKMRLSMTVQRFVALAYSRSEMYQQEHYLLANIPVPKLQIQTTQVSTALEKFSLNIDRPILSLCPGAEYGPAKQWPAYHFASLANEKLLQGWQVWIFGSQKDQAIAREIIRLTHNQVFDLTGRTELAEAIDMMSLSNVVVSNDSGLMHMAAALAVPVVGIYGSSDPGFTPPLGNNSAIVSLKLECSPCFKRICPLGHTDCLNKLLPQKVVEVMDNLISAETGDA